MVSLIDHVNHLLVESCQDFVQNTVISFKPAINQSCGPFKRGACLMTLRLGLFSALQSFPGSTGACQDRVCSACSSSSASVSPTTDSISMSSSLCDNAGVVRGWKRLEVSFAVCTPAWICTAEQRKNKEITRLNCGFIREGEGQAVLTFKTTLICDKCGTWVDNDAEMHKENIYDVQVPVPEPGLSI